MKHSMMLCVPSVGIGSQHDGQGVPTPHESHSGSSCSSHTIPLLRQVRQIWVMVPQAMHTKSVIGPNILLASSASPHAGHGTVAHGYGSSSFGAGHVMSAMVRRP